MRIAAVLALVVTTSGCYDFDALGGLYQADGPAGVDAAADRDGATPILDGGMAGGEAGMACAGNATPCSGLCVDTRSDDANCGGCGLACNAGTQCQGGTCVSTCPTGQTDCAGVCTDKRFDGFNCGGCGILCGGAVCSQGMCVMGCESGRMPCGTSCVDTTSDPNNCGGCDSVCGSGQACRDSQCTTDWDFSTGSSVPVSGGWSGVAGNDYAVDRDVVLHTSNFGATWAPEATGTTSIALRDLAGVGTDLWAVGAGGTIVHSTGTGSWSIEPSGVSDEIDCVWSSTANTVAVTEFGAVLARETTMSAWNTVATLPETVLPHCLSGAGSDVWLVGTTAVWRSSDGGRSWNPELEGTVAAVFAVDATRVFALFPDGELWSSTGSGTWAPTTNPPPPIANGNYFALWGTSATDLYAGGDFGAVEHLVSGKWVAEATGSDNTVDSFFGSLGDVYAGCADGTILRRK